MMLAKVLHFEHSNKVFTIISTEYTAKVAEEVKAVGSSSPFTRTPKSTKSA
jgi:hypothetical protein